jgi:hypothetical protein
MAAQLGYSAEARESLEALAAREFATLTFDEEWLVSVGLLAETASALGDAERAAVLYRRRVRRAQAIAGASGSRRSASSMSTSENSGSSSSPAR